MNIIIAGLNHVTMCIRALTSSQCPYNIKYRERLAPFLCLLEIE